MESNLNIDVQILLFKVLIPKNKAPKIFIIVICWFLFLLLFPEYHFFFLFFFFVTLGDTNKKNLFLLFFGILKTRRLCKIQSSRTYLTKKKNKNTILTIERINEMFMISCSCF